MKYQIVYEYGQWKVQATEWGVVNTIATAASFDEAAALLACRTSGPVRVGMVTAEDR